MRALPFLALAACGSSSNPKSPDAPIVMIDAGPDAPAVGLVSVTVIVGTAPQTGAVVVFSDAAGKVIATQTTGADGKASQMMAAGGSVTCDPTGGTGTSHTVETVFDVQPGDQLVLGAPQAAFPVSNADGTVGVTVLGGAVGNAASYRINLGGYNCSSTSATTGAQNVPVMTSCLNSAGTFDALAIAVDANNQMLAYSVSTSLTPPGAGNTTSITMPAWRYDFATHNISFTNAPANATVNGQFLLKHDVAYFQLDLPALTLTSSGTGTLAIPYPKMLGTTVNYQIYATGAVTGGLTPVGQLDVVSPVASLTDQHADFTMPPRVLAREVYVPPGDSVPTVEWVTAAPSTGTSGGIVQMQWSSPTDQWIWAAAVPPGSTKVRFPDLPDVLATDRVTEDQAFSSAAVVFAEGSLFASATAFRANWLDVLLPVTTPYVETLTGIY